ncbi:MAG: SsrA-binding protein SmpB [Victivallales bacterium]|nr:SsrA-binding protein SmpB [Victivallales bacterium]
MKLLVKNRRARHTYHVLETFEAGIVLQGTEVKSCRAGNISLNEAYARVDDDELWLIGSHIAHYEQGNRNNHEAVRNRKLLMHRREIVRLRQAVEAKGQTLVPLAVGLSNGKVKVEIGLCRGKNVYDKRQDLKKRDAEREPRRAIADSRRA